MWSDNETSIDLLGFQHLVSAATAIVRDERLLPATIGVFGDWGSGKSSLLQMATEELRTDNRVLVVSFNGWLFEGYEDAKSALMGTILDEIKGARDPKDKALEILNRLLRRVDWFRTLTSIAKYGVAFGLAGPAGLGFVAAADAGDYVMQVGTKAKDLDPDELKKLFREAPGQEIRTAVRDFRKDFQQLLDATDIRTLVVVIDDLDRCLPDTIIETLEAIKLFLFVPRTAFLLGADERLVKYAVRRRFPELPGERAEVGRDYLEKLVQFPIRVPPLGRSEMETYINFLFAQNAGLTNEQFEKSRQCVLTCDANSLLDVRFNHGVAQTILGSVSPELADGLSLAQRIAPILASQLNGNPRQCKRFLNTLMVRRHMAASRSIQLQQRILAKLMILEYFKPEAFRSLGKLQAEQSGQPKELAFMESEVSPVRRATGTPKADGAKGKSRKTDDHAPERDRRRSTAPEAAPRREEQLLVDTWLADGEVREWLVMEPPLGAVDLRPYFYFSRDTLGSLSGAAQRMSQVAQHVFAELFGDSEAVRLAAVGKAQDMSTGDAAAIFEGLADRVRTEEDAGADNSALARMFDWTAARPELFGQLIALLNALPDSGIPPSYVLRLRRLAKDVGQVSLGDGMLRKWSQSTTNAPLHNAAVHTIRAKNA